MSDRVDPKLASVPLARFRYRHEAEFAAGFLDDAEIPYRLQVDDAVMGMSIGNPATLWVRRVDLQEARELLDLPESPVAEQAPAGPARPRVSGSARPVPASDEEQAIRYGLDRSSDRLSGMERAVSLVLFGGCAGGALVALSGPGGTLLAAALGVLSAPFALGALFARTVAPVRGLIRALAGSAP